MLIAITLRKREKVTSKTELFTTKLWRVIEYTKHKQKCCAVEDKHTLSFKACSLYNAPKLIKT